MSETKAIRLSSNPTDPSEVITVDIGKRSPDTLLRNRPSDGCNRGLVKQESRPIIYAVQRRPIDLSIVDFDNNNNSNHLNFHSRTIDEDITRWREMIILELNKADLGICELTVKEKESIRAILLESSSL
mgnify:CR=1 FL=1